MIARGRLRPTLLLPLALALVACSESGERPVAPAADMATAPTVSVAFTDRGSEFFGTFDGVDFVRHTGLFEGETSLGEFRVPFEIVAPDAPGQGNRTVLVEPPHWALAPLGRDLVIGRDLVFGSGFSYASVAFGSDGFNILDASVPDLVIAGEPVESPGQLKFAGISDDEILVQFTEALTSEPFASSILGTVDRTYAYGISQTADVLLETLHRVTGTASHDLFDLTVLHGAGWRIEAEGIARPGGPLELIGGEYAPLGDVGRVLFVEAEGDLRVFDAERLRRAADHPVHRVYEVAGGAHLPTPANPLDHWAVARAILFAGDAWIQRGEQPPASKLLAPAASGAIDPVYGEVTGIARDADLNALGGIRLPDLDVGRTRFVASDPASPPPLGIPGLEPLTGSTVDLACEPAPGSRSDEPRFANHGDYVDAFTRQVNELRRQGFLLEADAEALKERAAESEVGKPGSCS